MKTLIIYDTQYGNTEIIAQALAKTSKDIDLKKVDQVVYSDLTNYQLIVVGSPTHGGCPTIPLQNFFKTIPANYLSGIKVAAFDTRMNPENLNIFLKILIKIIGFASPKILKTLISLGGESKGEFGFLVQSQKGPLYDDELELALDWFKKLYLT